MRTLNFLVFFTVCPSVACYAAAESSAPAHASGAPDGEAEVGPDRPHRTDDRDTGPGGDSSGDADSGTNRDSHIGPDLVQPPDVPGGNSIPMRKPAPANDSAIVASEAPCHDAWLAIEAERPTAQRVGDPFQRGSSAAKTWWRKAVTPSGALVAASPAQYDVFDAISSDGSIVHCAVPTAWNARAGLITVGIDAKWKRISHVVSTNRTSGLTTIGEEASGGFDTVFENSTNTHPYRSKLRWDLRSISTAIDAKAVSKLLSIPAMQPIALADIQWDVDVALESSLAVSFGATSEFRGRPLWGIAGKAIYDNYRVHFLPSNAPTRLGFVSFASLSDDAPGILDFAKDSSRLNIGEARLWNPIKRDFPECDLNPYTSPFAEQCAGMLTANAEALRRSTLVAGKNLCPTVLWASSQLGGVVATTACITSTGDIVDAKSEFVTLGDLGFPSIEEIDTLESFSGMIWQ